MNRKAQKLKENMSDQPISKFKQEDNVWFKAGNTSIPGVVVKSGFHNQCLVSIRDTKNVEYQIWVQGEYLTKREGKTK